MHSTKSAVGEKARKICSDDETVDGNDDDDDADRCWCWLVRLPQTMDTNISVFQHGNEWSSTHTRSLNPNVCPTLGPVSSFLPLFPSALFNSSNSIHFKLHAKEMWKNREKNFFSFNKHPGRCVHIAQCSNLCEPIVRAWCVFTSSHSVLFIFTHSEFVQTIDGVLFSFFLFFCCRWIAVTITYLCTSYICCVCHIPFSASPDSWERNHFF